MHGVLGSGSPSAARCQCAPPDTHAMTKPYEITRRPVTKINDKFA